MQTVTLIVFCATVVPLIFTPGPDVMYITTRGIAQGRRAPWYRRSVCVRDTSFIRSWQC